MDEAFDLPATCLAHAVTLIGPIDANGSLEPGRDPYAAARLIGGATMSSLPDSAVPCTNHHFVSFGVDVAAGRAGWN